MKKKAISFVLCLMMVVTLFGNGIPVYAANESEPPIVATEETGQDAPEESEAEESPAVEASEAAHVEDTNATEEETEVKPSEATDTEERATVNTADTTEGAVAEETPDGSNPPVGAIGDLVQLNVHKYVGGILTGTSTRDVVKQMNPKLADAAGKAYEPVLRDNGFTFDWKDIPAGEYTLTFDTPAGWQFRAGQTHSGEDYLNSGKKITVHATATEQDFYTQLEELFYPTVGIEIDGKVIYVPKGADIGSTANLPEAFKNVKVKLGSVERSFGADTVGSAGMPLALAFYDYPNSTFVEGVYPIEVSGVPDGYTYTIETGKDAMDHITEDGIRVDGTLPHVDVCFAKADTPDEPKPPVKVAKRVQLSVHTLVDGKKNFATRDMLEQMNPVLRAEDGQEVKPVRIADNGFTFDFEQVPAGEYTLAFTYPAGYRFAPGKVGSDMFGDYLDTGAKVTVTAGYVVNNFYTRLEKTPDEPNPPVEVAKRVELNVHTLVDGKKDFATKDMLEQMNPVLRAEDGQEVKPVRIADNGFTFDFEQVPAGEYTLAFTYPAGYRFAPGKVGSDMFGDYLDTGAKVTVTAGYVVNNFYTRLEKTPDEPNPPVNPPTQKTGNLTVTKTVSGSGGDQNKVPKTGDSSNLALWGILAAASLLSLTVLLAGTKTRKVRSQGKEHQN